jgi:hypothetical protein
MWNVCDAREDKSIEWHNIYFCGATVAMDYVTPRCTVAMTGMSASERA